MKNLQTLKKEWLKTPEIRQAYDEQAEEFQLACALIEARIAAGLSQVEVAQRMGTTQSVIARLESGRSLPSFRTMQRFAQAVGGRAVLRIESAPIH